MLFWFLATYASLHTHLTAIKLVQTYWGKISSFTTFPGGWVVGWVVGWLGGVELKLKLTQPSWNWSLGWAWQHPGRVLATTNVLILITLVQRLKIWFPTVRCFGANPPFQQIDNFLSSSVNCRTCNGTYRKLWILHTYSYIHNICFSWKRSMLLFINQGM